MLFQYDITYMKCSFCTSKVNCHICEEEIRTTLRPMQLEQVKIDMLAKKLQFASEQEEDDLLDGLEAVGIFI